MASAAPLSRTLMPSVGILEENRQSEDCIDGYSDEDQVDKVG